VYDNGWQWMKDALNPLVGADKVEVTMKAPWGEVNRRVKGSEEEMKQVLGRCFLLNVNYEIIEYLSL